MKTCKILLLASLIAMPLAHVSVYAASEKQIQTRFDTIGLGVALGGYDPVSYFPEGGGKPAKGFVLRDFKYEGVTYRFNSDANRELFRANPGHYVPAYNGWCAWAMAESGNKVDIEPTAYEIYNGKLYVFYDHPDLSTHDLWLKDPKGMVERANAKWKAQSK